MLSSWGSAAGSIIPSGLSPGKPLARHQKQETGEKQREEDEREERRHDPGRPAASLRGQEIRPGRAEQSEQREEDRGDDKGGHFLKASCRTSLLCAPSRAAAPRAPAACHGERRSLRACPPPSR